MRIMFYKVVNAKVNIAKVDVSKGIHGVTLDYLSQKWLILPEVARRTVHHTTQREIRTFMHPSLL